MSAVSVRGEWEAERGRGRGIVAGSNGGFPPPVSQAHHVTRPDKEREQEFRGRLERAEAERDSTPQTGQSINQTLSSLLL